MEQIVGATGRRRTDNETLVVNAIQLGRQTLAKLSIDVIRAQEGRDEHDKVQRDEGERRNVARRQSLLGELLILESAPREEGTRKTLV